MSDSDVDTQLVDLERRLLRGVLIRRLVIGIGGIAVGIACLALSVVLVIQNARLIRAAMVAAILGVLAIGGGFVTLRVGEIREDLSVHQGSAPVSWKAIALASTGFAFVVFLVAAWPLGIYRSLGSLSSPCRKVLTSKDVVALGGAPFDVAHVDEQPSQCVLTGVAPGTDRRVIQVRIDNALSGYTLDGHRRFFAARREERLGQSDDAWLLERDGERMIAVRRGGDRIYVNLASSTYDDATTRRIAGRIVGP